MRSRETRREREAVSATRENDSLRCSCGSLLARLVPDGVELKCRRCKRQIIVPLNGRAAMRVSM
jgi:hypothetical protein